MASRKNHKWDVKVGNVRCIACGAEAILGPDPTNTRTFAANYRMDGKTFQKAPPCKGTSGA